jgi:hypothetical protein
VTSLEQMVRRGYIEAGAMLAMHEAAHAAVAIFAGLRVASCTIDAPTRLGGGLMQLEHAEMTTLAHLLTIMSGPLATGTPLAWRPLDVGDGSDEGNAAIACYLLDIDEAGWRDADQLTKDMLAHPPVMRARRALAANLYAHGTLDGAEVHRLVHEATCAPQSEREGS